MPREAAAGGMGEAGEGAYLRGGALRARGRAGARRCSGAAWGRSGRAGRPSRGLAARFQPQAAGRGPSADSRLFSTPLRKQRVEG